MFGEIALVEHQQLDARLCFSSRHFRPRGAAVHNVEAKIRLTNGLLGPSHALLLEFVGCVAQTGSINKTNRETLKIYCFFNRVPGGSMGFANDNTVMTQKA